LRRGDSRPNALGVDFARNLTTSFEVHGELAWFDDRARPVLDTGNTLITRETGDFDWLLGLRYLTSSETTWIVEYYHNGAGYSANQMQHFYDLARSGVTNPALRARAQAARQAGYGTSQPMRDYLYIKASQKEPFDALYWNASATAIVNLHDGSYNFIPEVSYTGITDLELRGRLGFLIGGTHSDFGERPNEWRAELRVRYFF
jgi:peptidoglycan/xylan/chitin deacetylase (PgdA/CDA1 family)